MTHLINEYKEGKAYRYFTVGWVYEVFYHQIIEESPHCVLKCRVTPSQRVSSTPYHAWAIIEKDTQVKPGGKILNAYCTCTAGLHGSCNHIAGLLFRVKAAVLRGLTNPTCTDRLARWTVPPTKTELSPCPVSKITFEKDHYRTAFSIDRDRQAANISSRLEFSPLSAEQELYVENKQSVRANLYKLIKVHAPKCCFVELMEEKKLNRKVKLDTLTSIIERIELFEYNDTKTVNENVKSFTETLKLSNSELDAIKQNTIGQAAVTDWFKQREGRLTTSRFHHVCTRVASLQASQSEDPTNLIASLLGYKKIPETASMKHGKTIGPHAKSFYISAVKKAP